jgi:hypothetical protein
MNTPSKKDVGELIPDRFVLQQKMFFLLLEDMISVIAINISDDLFQVRQDQTRPPIDSPWRHYFPQCAINLNGLAAILV